MSITQLRLRIDDSVRLDLTRLNRGDIATSASSGTLVFVWDT